MFSWEIFVAGIVTAFGVLILGIALWIAVSSDRMRAWLSRQWTRLALRAKFRREANPCVVCDGTGESIFNPTPLGPPPVDGEDLQYEGDPITMPCSRCDGTGVSYIYTYRFKFWSANSLDEFEADHDKVETVLGGSSEHLRRK